MFTQIGSLIKSRGPQSVLGNLVPRRVIAVGESQSAGYLTTYVNAIDPTARVFDGFLIHSRSGSSASLTPGIRPAAAPPGTAADAPPAQRAPQRIVKMRTDLRV